MKTTYSILLFLLIFNVGQTVRADTLVYDPSLSSGPAITDISVQNAAYSTVPASIDFDEAQKIAMTDDDETTIARNLGRFVEFDFEAEIGNPDAAGAWRLSSFEVVFITAAGCESPTNPPTFVTVDHLNGTSIMPATWIPETIGAGGEPAKLVADFSGTPALLLGATSTVHVPVFDFSFCEPEIGMTEVNAQVTAVPEPSSLALLALGGLLLLRNRKRA